MVWDGLRYFDGARTEAVFYLNNRLNVLLNLKENCTLKYAFS